MLYIFEALFVVSDGETCPPIDRSSLIGKYQSKFKREGEENKKDQHSK